MAFQQFAFGVLEFTQLDFGALDKIVGYLKRDVSKWFHLDDVSLMGFRIYTLWVIIKYELSASSSAKPFHLTVNSRLLCIVAYASKGGRRAMHW